MMSDAERQAVARSLPPMQRIIFRAVHVGRDTKIANIYKQCVKAATLLRTSARVKRSQQREQQMYIGASIVRLNLKLKLKGYAVRPGATRGTYTLIRLPRA
jgi:hypothetical protein